MRVVAAMDRQRNDVQPMAASSMTASSLETSIVGTLRRAASVRPHSSSTHTTAAAVLSGSNSLALASKYCSIDAW